MCSPLAIAPAFAAGSAILGNREAAKAQDAQNKALAGQNRELIRQGNIQSADLSLQARTRLEEATQDLTANNMQSVQAMGTIRTAIGESMLEGNSMERVDRVSRGDFVRQANNITENYTRDYQAIFAQQLGVKESTLSQVRNNNQQMQKGKSPLEQALGVGMAAGAAFDWSKGFGGGSGSKAPIVAAKGTKTGR